MPQCIRSKASPASSSRRSMISSATGRKRGGRTGGRAGRLPSPVRSGDRPRGSRSRNLALRRRRADAAPDPTGRGVGGVRTLAPSFWGYVGKCRRIGRVDYLPGLGPAGSGRAPSSGGLAAGGGSGGMALFRGFPSHAYSAWQNADFGDVAPDLPAVTASLVVFVLDGLGKSLRDLDVRGRPGCRGRRPRGRGCR